MSRQSAFEFRTATAEQIVEAVLTRQTTYDALIAFRQRIGTRKADKVYPQTRDALNLMREHRAQIKRKRLITDTLAPFNERLADGADVLDIIQPMVDDWKEFFFNREGVGLMDDQALIMAMLLSADYLNQLKGGK